jgi:beta-xylosidase
MFVSLFAVLAVLLCGAALLQAKDNPMGVADQQTITFTAPIHVGADYLPAGDYKVLHEMKGEDHIMVFKQIGGKAKTSAKCTLVPLPDKATRTEQRYTENAKNERVLVEMTFRGDRAKHVLVQ